jgi:protein TonB
MDFKDLLKRDLDDIVFEHRNKAYGAYTLRKTYGEHIKKAIGVGGSIFLLSVSSPLIADRIKPKEKGLNMAAVEMIDLPKAEDLPKPPSPPPPPPPPPVKQIKTVAFTSPKVLEDRKVSIEVPIVPDVTDAAISNKTQEGESGENLAPLTEIAPPSVPTPPVEVEEEKVEEEKPQLIVEQNPEFPDGNAAMMRFLQEHMKYPVLARENGIEGTVFVSFVVAKDGSIQKVEIKRGIGGGCNEEAMRVVNMMPKWKPGKQQGKAVPVYFTLPVKFKLN